jgi:hypothetical protein
MGIQKANDIECLHVLDTGGLEVTPTVTAPTMYADASPFILCLDIDVA